MKTTLTMICTKCHKGQLFQIGASHYDMNFPKSHGTYQLKCGECGTEFELQASLMEKEKELAHE